MGKTMTDSDKTNADKRSTEKRNGDKRNAWLRQLDEECPYQVVLPRQQLCDDSEILSFLIEHVEKFDMYVEDDYAAFVRYCFEDPMDAEVFRARSSRRRNASSSQDSSSANRHTLPRHRRTRSGGAR